MLSVSYIYIYTYIHIYIYTYIYIYIYIFIYIYIDIQKFHGKLLLWEIMYIQFLSMPVINIRGFSFNR